MEQTALEDLVVDRLVNGGQAIGRLKSGQVAFVWNALPGEEVRVRVIKRRKQYVEAIAEEIVESSPERVEPRDAAFMATSPWQILSRKAEARAKQQIVKELLEGQKIDWSAPIAFNDSPLEWHYRNKMEYSFWGDDQGLHLALHQRGSHQKQIVSGSSLAMPAVDELAQAVLDRLSKKQVRAGMLKTIIVRSNQKGQARFSLFVKDSQLELPDFNGLNGRVYFSNPKSPASVRTELIESYGQIELSDQLLESSFSYDADSFFQVNLPVYEQVLLAIKQQLNGRPLVDLYGGVGSIGISVADKKLTIVESDSVSAAYASQNAKQLNFQAQIINSPVEKVLTSLGEPEDVVVDPPRAGLHPSLINAICEGRVRRLVYLSCNPATLCRDIALLAAGGFKLNELSLYNFFPKTPHIETLTVLSRP